MDLNETDKRIETLFEEWKTLQPLKKEYQEIFDKKVRLDWNYHSSRIEGNTLTYGETELLLFFGRMEGGHLERNYMEMKAHDVAIRAVQGWVKDDTRPLTENDIRDLNKILLKEPFIKTTQTPDGKETQKEIIPGEYKKQPNHVQTASGEIFKFAEPAEVPAKMAAFTKWLCEELEQPTLAISDLLAKLHHDFIVIHPFDDGNGRVVRLLLNYALLKLGYPPMVIKSSDRDNYLAVLNKADTGDMDALAVYLGKYLISWLGIGIKAAKGEDIREPDDIDKEVDLFVKAKSGKHTLPDINRYEILYEGFLEPFITDLKKRFAPFEKLFESLNFEPYHNANNLDELLTFCQSFVQASDFLTLNRDIHIGITYERYKHTEEAFSIRNYFHITFLRINYTVELESHLHRPDHSEHFFHGDNIERTYYSQTEEDINTFLGNAKQAMFNQIQAIEK